MDPIHELLRVMSRRWWVFVLIVGLTVGSAACFTARQRSIFQASNLVVVLPSRSLESDEQVIRGLDTLNGRNVVATFAKLASTSSILDLAVRELGVDPGELPSYDILGKVLPNKNMIEVEVRGPDPQLASRLANAVADRTCEAANHLYRIYELEVVERAEPPQNAVYPNPRRNYAVSGILGCFVGVFAAALLDRLRSSTGG